MFSCCKLCGAKYINEDDSIDNEVLLDAVESYTKQTIEDSRKRIKRGAGLKKRGLSEISFNPNKLCKCKCHIKGSDMIH